MQKTQANPTRAPVPTGNKTTPNAEIMVPATPAPAANGAKKKGKKSADPMDARKQLEAKIAQLELDAAGEKDQEAEIEREVRKANRELNTLLNRIDGDNSRIAELQTRYSKLLSEMKRTEREYAKAKKRGDLLQKEKEAGRSEMVKVTAARDKLDKLSRNMAEENKKLRDKCDQLEESERQMKLELHERIEQMEEDVAQIIQAYEEPEPHGLSMEQDEIFRAKFKSFIEQWELREMHFHSLLRMKDLELQYERSRSEQQRKVQEMESSKSNQLTRQVSTFSQTETELRSQLNIYVEKFKQVAAPILVELPAALSSPPSVHSQFEAFLAHASLLSSKLQQVEDTLNNSNDLFLTFRKEMEEMSKKTKRLEKENQTLTRKQEATNRNILEMAEERSKAQMTIADLRKDKERLEKICRAMQAQGRGQALANNHVPEVNGASSSGQVNGHNTGVSHTNVHGDPMTANFAEIDDVDEDATDDSEYYDEDEEGSEEYDDETEEESIETAPRPFGPVPPPPPPPSKTGVGANGKVRSWPERSANGVVGH